MALVDLLRTDFPNRDRLAACEDSQRANPGGQQICANFEASIDGGLIDRELLERFCARLGELLPDPPEPCDAKAVADRIDTPEAFCCRGPDLHADGSTQISRLTDLAGYVYAKGGDPAIGPELEEARTRLRRRRDQPRPPGTERCALGARRPFFWITPTADVLDAGPADAAALRDLLGLAHIRRGPLIEMRLTADRVGPLYRPLILDAYDHWPFLPFVAADGWGRTRNLSASDPSPGLPEAVAGAVERTCQIVDWGDV